MNKQKFLFVALSVYVVSTLISMAAMSVGVALVFFALVLNYRAVKFKVELKRDEIKKYALLSLFLTVACVVSLIYAIINPLSFNGRFSEVHFFSDIAKVWYLFWPLILVVGLKQFPEKERLKVFQIWMWAFVTMSILGIFQYYVGWPRPHRIPGNEERFHAVLFMGHHLSVTSIFIFPLFLALDLKKYVWVVLGCVLGCALLFFTYSRMMWVALPVGFLAWALRTMPPKKTLAISAVLAAMSFAAYQLPVIKNRLNDMLGVGDRQYLRDGNLHFFKQRPITGVGWMHNHELYGIFRKETAPNLNFFVGHAHNNLLQMMSGTGILGAAAWLAWAVFVLIMAWKKSPGLFAAWVVFHVNGLTQVNFWEAKVQHQMAWVVALLLFGNAFWMNRVNRGKS
jgi:O-antigen ligase